MMLGRLVCLIVGHRLSESVRASVDGFTPTRTATGERLEGRWNVKFVYDRECERCHTWHRVEPGFIPPRWVS